MRLNKELEPILRQIVRSATGQDPTEFEAIDLVGMSNKVIIVSIASGRLVVRLNSPEHLPNYEKEAWCLEQAHEAGILVARVVAYGVTDTHAYSISYFIEGSTPIDEKVDQTKVWRILGSYASKLNSMPVKGYGDRMYSKGDFKLTWQEMLDSELRIIFRDNYWAESNLLSPTQYLRVKEELEKCFSIEARAGICHWDIGCRNARIRNSNYNEIFLFDLELALVAPVPHYQFACVAKPWGIASNEMKAFVEGYGVSDVEQSEILPEVRRFVVMKAMRSVRWAQDRRPQYTEKLMNEAVTTIRELLGI